MDNCISMGIGLHRRDVGLASPGLLKGRNSHVDVLVLAGSDAVDTLPDSGGRAGDYCQVVSEVILC